MIAIRRYGCHQHIDLSIDAPTPECIVACGVMPQCLSSTGRYVIGEP
jgi:hypothetical protein